MDIQISNTKAGLGIYSNNHIPGRFSLASCSKGVNGETVFTLKRGDQEGNPFNKGKFKSYRWTTNRKLKHIPLFNAAWSIAEVTDKGITITTPTELPAYRPKARAIKVIPVQEIKKADIGLPLLVQSINGAVYKRG